MRREAEAKKKKAAQPAAIDEVADLIATARKLCGRVNELAASAQHGGRLWDTGMRIVMEKTIAELAKRGRLVASGGSHGFQSTVVVPPRFL